MATYVYGGRTVSQAEFKKAVYGSDSKAYEQAVAKETAKNDLSTFGSSSRRNTSVSTTRDGTTQYYENDELVKEVNADGSSVLRVDVSEGATNPSSPSTQREVFIHQQQSFNEQQISDYNAEVERVNSINKELKRTKAESVQEFLDSTGDLTAKEFYATYDVMLSEDGGYRITPKPNQKVIMANLRPKTTIEIMRDSQAPKNTYSQLRKDVPIRETAVYDLNVNYDSSKDFVGTFDNFNLDESRVMSSLVSPTSVNLAVDSDRLSTLSKFKPNLDNIDFIERELAKTNYEFNRLQQADTTTELFINNPNANPSAFNINLAGETVKSNVQDFYDIQNTKTIGITVASFGVTLGAGAGAGLLAKVPRLASAVKGSSAVIKVVYPTSVLVRGGIIAGSYDGSKPTKTIYKLANLIGEVGGVGLGVRALAFNTPNVNSYRQVLAKNVKGSNGGRVLLERGTFLTRNAGVRSVKVTGVVDKAGSGRYALKVSKPNGKGIVTDTGSLKYLSEAKPTGLSGGYRVEATTRATSDLTKKTVFTVTNGRVDFFGTGKGFNRVSANVLTGGTGTVSSSTPKQFAYNGLKDLTAVRVIGTRYTGVRTKGVIKGFQNARVSGEMSVAEMSKVLSSGRFRLSEAMPFLSVSKGFVYSGGGFNSLTGAQAVTQPLGLSKVSSVAVAESGVLSPNIVGSFASDTLAISSSTPVFIASPVLFSGSKPVSNNYVAVSPLISSSSVVSSPSSSLTVAPSFSSVDISSNVDTDSNSFLEVSNVVGNDSRTKPLTEAKSDFKTVSETLTEPSLEVVSESINDVGVDVGVDVTAEPLSVVTPDYYFRFGADFVGGSPNVPIPIIPVSIIPRLNFGRGRAVSEGFDVEVRQRGVFVKANAKKLALSEALDLGSAIVSNRASATFRYVKNSSAKLSKDLSSFSTQNTQGSFKRLKSTFKKKGKGVFIEKERFRINTAGEKREITLKGLETIRGFKL